MFLRDFPEASPGSVPKFDLIGHLSPLQAKLGFNFLPRSGPRFFFCLPNRLQIDVILEQLKHFKVLNCNHRCDFFTVSLYCDSLSLIEKPVQNFRKITPDLTNGFNAHLLSPD